MQEWNSANYLKFGDERTQPSRDLVTRLAALNPSSIVDLGCGPGNSTHVLHQQWPSSKLVGIDNSEPMLKAARESLPNADFRLQDLSLWRPSQKFDLVFSNAAFQWLPNHSELLPRLFEAVVANGVFAFQIPSRKYALIRSLMMDISRDKAWDHRMQSARTALTMEEPGFYYDLLVPLSSRIDIWETEYYHILESHVALVDWMASTGLRPFLAGLNEEESAKFVDRLVRRVGEEYPLQSNGNVLFPFRRTFVIAYRQG